MSMVVQTMQALLSMTNTNTGVPAPNKYLRLSPTGSFRNQLIVHTMLLYYGTN
jgi:hypothetical protein